MIGGGVFCGGLAIFAYVGCKAATYGTLQLGKKSLLASREALSGRRNCDG